MRVTELISKSKIDFQLHQHVAERYVQFLVNQTIGRNKTRHAIPKEIG